MNRPLLLQPYVVRSAPQTDHSYGHIYWPAGPKRTTFRPSFDHSLVAWSPAKVGHSHQRRPTAWSNQSHIKSMPFHPPIAHGTTGLRIDHSNRIRRSGVADQRHPPTPPIIATRPASRTIPHAGNTLPQYGSTSRHGSGPPKLGRTLTQNAPRPFQPGAQHSVCIYSPANNRPHLAKPLRESYKLATTHQPE